MSYFMTPDLLLHGLFNTHSPRQNKYFLFLKLKISAHTCKQKASFQLFCKQNPLNWPSYAWILLYPIWHILSLIYDTVSNSYSYCIWWWSQIPGMLNEKGKLKQTEPKQAYILRNTPFSCELYLHLEMGMNCWWL